MRIGIMGKGGSGKSTLAALLALEAVQAGQQTLAIDADINQTLGLLLGFDEVAVATCPPIGTQKEALHRHIQGQGALALSQIIKTTLPQPGSRLIALEGADPVLGHYGLWRDKLCLLPVGGFMDDDIGQRCYHSKTGAIELLLNHLPDQRDDVVLVDMTAGADLFASGFFTRFDMLVLVIEPHAQSVRVAEQILAYAAPYGPNIQLVGNKLRWDDDAAYLQQHFKRELLAQIPMDVEVARAARQGPLARVQSETKAALQKLLQALHQCPRDKASYWAQAVHFHTLNARGWANAATGTDLTQQVNKAYLESLEFPA